MKRTAGILPNRFWDKTSYVLGRTAAEGRRTAEEHAAFKGAHRALLAGTQDEGIVALLRFLETWASGRFDDPPFKAEMLDCNVVFRLDGDRRDLHEREAAQALLATSAAVEGGQFCLVTGRRAATTRLLACAEAGIALSFLDPNGRFLAHVEGPRTGNVLLREAQFRAAEPASHAAVIARGIVAAKAANRRAVIRRALRDHADGLPPATVVALGAAEARLTDVARRTFATDGIDGLRGLDGEGAAAYFAVCPALTRVDDPAVRFGGRSRRPPLDRINALLSVLYAMLGHDCRAALETHGRDPQVGLLHADRPGRAGLALNLMEDLRPVLADRLALSLVNRRQLAASDFVVEDAGGVRLTDDARKRVLVAWQDRKRDELRHPFLDEAMPLGLVAHAQAQMLARHLRGDLDRDPAFVWK